VWRFGCDCWVSEHGGLNRKDEKVRVIESPIELPLVLHVSKSFQYFSVIACDELGVNESLSFSTNHREVGAFPRLPQCSRRQLDTCDRAWEGRGCERVARWWNVHLSSRGGNDGRHEIDSSPCRSRRRFCCDADTPQFFHPLFGSAVDVRKATPKHSSNNRQDVLDSVWRVFIAMIWPRVQQVMSAMIWSDSDHRNTEPTAYRRPPQRPLTQASPSCDRRAIAARHGREPRVTCVTFAWRAFFSWVVFRFLFRLHLTSQQRRVIIWTMWRDVE
jgi:hypothetical protein